MFPRGLAQVVASTQKRGGNCRVSDYTNKYSSEELLKDAIKEMQSFSPRIVGLTGLSHNYLFYKSLTHSIKAMDREIVIVAGGHWARYEPEFILNTTDVDIVVRKEGDYAISDLYDAVEGMREFSHIKGIVYKHGIEIIHNK